MNNEIQHIAAQMKDAYEGEPWFGRCIRDLLSEVDENIAFDKPGDQHSIVELIWHMITWKEFVISRLKERDAKTLHQFESEDWRELDHSDRSLLQKGKKELDRLHTEMVQLVMMQNDEILNQKVKERNYDFRKLLNGIIQHDIYHIGQIVYVKKLLSN